MVDKWQKRKKIGENKTGQGQNNIQQYSRPRSVRSCEINELDLHQIDISFMVI